MLKSLAINESYIVEYHYTVEPYSTFNIKEKTSAYFSIEIVNDLNINSESQKMYIKIPKAGLSLSPRLTYNANEITRTDLEFTIINGEGKVVFF